MSRHRYVSLLFFLLMLYPGVLAQDTSSDSISSRLKKGVILGDVEVVGKHKFGVESSQMSAIRISPQQLKLVPMFMGEPDVLKALQKLPGVTSAGDGTAGIYVRGGNYDQNLITLDGATLYNPEHLKGYASAINPDMVANIDFYRGAFPARYGSRLSSVVDVTLKEGDFNKYHGSLFLGMLTGGVQAEGPIWKGRTSFNVSGRMSYFNVFAYPIMKKFYDDTEILEEYSRMKFFDVTAKITHKFSKENKVSASFYYGKDNDDTKPSKSEDIKWNYGGLLPRKTVYSRENSMENEWSNMCGAIDWSMKVNNALKVGVLSTYSKYDYEIGQHGLYTYDEVNSLGHDVSHSLEQSDLKYISDIQEFSIDAFAQWTPTQHHDIRCGVKGANIRLIPNLEIKRLLENRKYQESVIKDVPSVLDYVSQRGVDTIMGGKQNLRQLSVYVEDDYSLNRNIKLNLGVRASLHSVSSKTYTSIEPRLSMRWKFFDKNAVKLSYSRMAQAIHRLSTNNLISPSDLWIPISKELPLMNSNLYALGYNRELPLGVDVSLEGYYKTMDNVAEYRENIQYAVGSTAFEDMITTGTGVAYGVELLAEKRAGNFTGWVSYTWSKALRKFDKRGAVINAGKEFYANNDRRHNLSLVGTYKFQFGKNKALDITASWTYLTGRRGTLPVVIADYGVYVECNPYGGNWWDADFTSHYRFSEISNPELISYFKKVLGMMTYRELNDYKLPDTHHLDISANFSIKHKYGESIVGLSVYNIYNQMNPSAAYVAVSEEDVVLKCICPFPIMPSLSYTHKF